MSQELQRRMDVPRELTDNLHSSQLDDDSDGEEEREEGAAAVRRPPAPS